MSGYLYDKNNKSGILARILAGICVLGIIISILTLMVAFPTSKHRQTAQQINAVRMQTKDEQAVLKSPKYKELQATPEAKYSAIASLTIAVANIIFVITVTGVLYRYLRKSKIVQNAVVSTTVLFTGAWAIIIPVIYIFETKIFMGQSIDWSELVKRELLNLTFGYLLCLVVVRVFKRRFDRAHSFSLEK